MAAEAHGADRSVRDMAAALWPDRSMYGLTDVSLLRQSAESFSKVIAQL